MKRRRILPMRQIPLKVIHRSVWKIDTKFYYILLSCKTRYGRFTGMRENHAFICPLVSLCLFHYGSYVWSIHVQSIQNFSMIFQWKFSNGNDGLQNDISKSCVVSALNVVLAASFWTPFPFHFGFNLVNSCSIDSRFRQNISFSIKKYGLYVATRYIKELHCKDAFKIQANLNTVRFAAIRSRAHTNNNIQSDKQRTYGLAHTDTLQLYLTHGRVRAITDATNKNPIQSSQP